MASSGLLRVTRQKNLIPATNILARDGDALRSSTRYSRNFRISASPHQVRRSTEMLHKVEHASGVELERLGAVVSQEKI
jgi:hypothetical protein